jgi:hypothetical protein
MKRPRLRFQFEVEILRGDEGRELRLEQARAIKDLLMCCRRNAATPPTNLTIGPPTRMSTKTGILTDWTTWGFAPSTDRRWKL